MDMNFIQAANNVVVELHELAELTSNENGAQRIAWTPIWDRAIDWFIQKMRAAGSKISIDSAHNIWACLEGETKESVVFGSHLDSVPNGGWLDGALGIVAGMQVIQSCTRNKMKPKKTIYVVNWADEEGARFGYSCLGSAAASGCLDTEKIKELTDAEGIHFSDVLNIYNLKADDFRQAHQEFLEKDITAYAELHIEQSPILEQQGEAAAAVYGITGCNRQYITFKGQPSHAGSPVSMRHDAFLCAARAALEFEKLAIKHNAYCTVGTVNIMPNIVTIFPGECTISLDQRSIDNDILKQLTEKVKEICQNIANENDVNVSFIPVWQNTPTIFPENLVKLAEKSVAEETGKPNRMFSGPLHDAVEIAKIVPSVMIFCMSTAGLSHCKEENTPDNELKISIRSFLRMADKLINK